MKIILLFLWLCWAFPVLGKEYEIVMERPAKIGQKIQMHATMHQIRATTASTPGRVIDRKTFERKYEIQAVLTVLAVNHRSRALQQTIELKKLVSISQNGAERTIAEPSTKFKVTFDN